MVRHRDKRKTYVHTTLFITRWCVIFVSPVCPCYFAVVQCMPTCIQANCPSVLTIKRLRNKLFSTRVCSETPYSTVRLATYMLKSTGCPAPDYQKYWSGGRPVCRTCSAALVLIECSTLRAQISIVDRCPRTGDTLRRLYVLQLCVLLYTLTARHQPATKFT